MTFSEWLSKQMGQRCETNYRLAKDLEVSQSTVAHWRAGTTVPHLSAIRQLAERYGVEREELAKLRNASAYARKSKKDAEAHA